MSQPSSSSDNTPTPSTLLSSLQPCSVATAEEVLLDSVMVSTIPALDDDVSTANDSDTNVDTTDGSDPVIYAALLARIEYLQSENLKLSTQHRDSKHYFRIEDIQSDDKLLCFYTGFTSFKIFMAFFEFLGPAKEHLNYWGEKTIPHK